MKTFLGLILLFATPALADPWFGGNPCNSDQPTILSAFGTTSGTTAVQIVSAAATQQIWVCSLNVQGVSGTNPTFSLVYGTGSNCATGQTALTPAFSTPANSLLPFSSPIVTVPAGKSLCYLDAGTTPVQNFVMSYVQK